MHVVSFVVFLMITVFFTAFFFIINIKIKKINLACILLWWSFSSCDFVVWSGLLYLTHVIININLNIHPIKCIFSSYLHGRRIVISGTYKRSVPHQFLMIMHTKKKIGRNILRELKRKCYWQHYIKTIFLKKISYICWKIS